jgi:hypothetical protein
MSTENQPKKAKIYVCEKCDYNTCKISNYTSHLTTTKHQKNTSGNITDTICLQEKKHVCQCGKEYLDRTGLWKHKKKCAINFDTNMNTNANMNTNMNTNTNTNANAYANIDLINENKSFKEFMIEQNQEFKSLIIELLKKETFNTINNNSNNNINNISNCNNQSFNLNFFLNEQCKDALNIDEFVDSIKMNLSDLENFAHLGYADGVSNIFSKGIKELGVHMRPIHCSDSKRETLYIKNNDEWIKETDDKPLITKAIKKVAFKNIKQINEWVKENPACKDPRTKKFDQYNKIVMNAMSGVTEEEQKNNIEKIVRNVTKSVAIEKYALQ